MMDTMEGEDSLQGVRSIFEKAIIATGLHVTEVGTQCVVVPKIPLMRRKSVQDLVNIECARCLIFPETAFSSQ